MLTQRYAFALNSPTFVQIFCLKRRELLKKCFAEGLKITFFEE